MKLEANAIEQYIEIIDKVAVVSKVDLEDNITYVNDLFCEISGYQEDELIGNHRSQLIHKDIYTSIYDDMNFKVSQGDTWNGTLKHIAKNGLPYYVTVTSFPLFEDEDQQVIGQMTVGFVTTDVEVEKKEFHKKVRGYVQENNRKFLKARSMIDDLKKENKELELQVAKLIHNADEIEQYKIRTKADRKQIDKMEVQIRTLTKSMEEKIRAAKEKYDYYATTNTQLMERNKKLEKLNEELTHKADTAYEQIRLMQEKLDEVIHQNQTMSDVFNKEKNTPNT